MSTTQRRPKKGPGSVKPIPAYLDDGEHEEERAKCADWRVRVSAGKGVDDRYKVVERAFHGTEEKAWRLVAKLVTEVDAGKLKREHCTLAALLDKVVEHKRTRGRAPRTVDDYARYAVWLTEKYGSVEIAKITPKWIDDLIDRVTREMGASSAVHYYRFLRLSLKLAETWDLIDRSPTDRMEGPSEPEPESESPAPETVRLLIDSAEKGVGKRPANPDFAVALYVAATTQLGPGELAGLQVCDVGFERLQLSVRQSISRVRGVKHVKATKTKARKAPVALDVSTAEALREQLDRITDRCEKLGVKLTPDRWLWSNALDHSEPVAPDWFAHRFDKLREALNLEGVRFYDLRHYGATQAIGAGVDIKTVQGHMRHATSRLTLDRYSHLLEAQGRAAAQAIAATLRGPAEP
ncbi:MAG: phage integrase family protein [Acidimicrobiaceae bacterium]|nr:phage integrase family protein [Acidimicrobiaceae bacterium]